MACGPYLLADRRAQNYSSHILCFELFERDEHFRNERRTECVTLGIVVKRDRRDVVGNFCLYECCCVSVILKLFRREVQQMRDNRAGCGQDPDRTSLCFCIVRTGHR